jgi:hypothetical protein
MVAKAPDLIHDDAAEGALIGCAFADQGVLDSRAQAIRPFDFYLPAHQAIWQAVRNLHSDGADVDSLTVTTELARLGRLEQAGGAAYLDQLLSLIPDTAHPETYARTVAELSRRREVCLSARRLFAAANDPKAKPGAVGDELDALRAAWDCGGDELPTQTAAEIDAMTWPQQPEWLIERWIASEACGWLAAHEKSSKTILAIGMALSVANGQPWLWRWPVAAGPVVFVAEEDHARRMQRRLRKVGRALGLDWRTGKLHIAAQQGCNLRDERGRGRLASVVRRVRPVLTVIDPWRRVTPGLNENDSEEVSELLGWARGLQRECRTAVLILDHMRKPAQGAQDTAKSTHRIRGSGDKAAWYDSFIAVSRKSETEHVIGTQHRDGGVGPLRVTEANPTGELRLSIAWDDERDELRITLPAEAGPTLPSRDDEPPPCDVQPPAHVEEQLPIEAYEEGGPF